MKFSTVCAGLALFPVLFGAPAFAQEGDAPGPAAPTEQAAPAEQAAPVEQAAPAEQAAPVEQAAPAGQAAPDAPAGAAEPQPAPPPEFVIDAGGWKGGAIGRPDNRQFSHCMVSRAYDNGVTLIFSMNPNYAFNIGLLKDGWGLVEGEKGEARIRVDAVFDAPFEAVPGGTNVYVVPTGSNVELFQALARGSRAVVTVPKGEFTFPLTGTMAGLGALRDCTEKARQLIAEAQARAGETGGATPAAGDPAAPDAAPDTVGAQGFGMTLQSLNALLVAVGLTEFRLADPTTIRRDQMAINHGWLLGPMFGGMHQEPRGEEVEIDTFAKRYLEIMRSGCPQDWQATEQPAAIDGPYAVKRAELLCTMEGTPLFVSLAFTLDDHYYTVFFHQATPTDKDQAIAATAKIADYVQNLMIAQAEAARAAPDATAEPAPEAAAEPAPDATEELPPEPEPVPAAEAPAEAPAEEAPAGG